jgi:uncharacterized protein Yka (UPF0111/DUF47 family)
MKQVAGPLRLELAQYRELAAFSQFTMLQLRHGARIVEILKQPQGQPLSVEEQVLLLFAVAVTRVENIEGARVEKKFFRPILPRYVGRTETALLRFFTSGQYLENKPESERVDILKEIREKKNLTDELTAKMTTAIEDFLWMPYEQLMLILGDPKNKDALGLSPEKRRQTEDALLLINFNERDDLRTLAKRDGYVTPAVESRVFGAISPHSQFARLKERGLDPVMKELIKSTTNFLTRLLELREIHLNEHVVAIREIKSQGGELPTELKSQLIEDLRSMLSRGEIQELFDKFETAKS